MKALTTLPLINAEIGSEALIVLTLAYIAPSLPVVKAVAMSLSLVPKSFVQAVVADSSTEINGLG